MIIGFLVRRGLIAAALLLTAPSAGWADSLDFALPIQTSRTSMAVGPSTQIMGDPGDSSQSAWYKRVDKAQATQPSWITPLATVTPRLEEEVRYDQFWQNLGNGARVDNFDGGKGVELIPTTTNEIIFNVPPYETRSYDKPAEGFADDTFFLIKQRLVSENARNGDYIASAFLSVLAPTGADAFTNHAWEITPTIAGGKGFGNFDVQATSGITFPTSHASAIGDIVATNIAVQYHVGKFWPEFEMNDTYWSGGERTGKNQVLLTPGVIVGRFKLSGRMKANFGVGYQWAVAPALIKEPLTPTYGNAWISTFRVSF